MKKPLLLISLTLMHAASLACEVCKKQQPKALRGITHGAGPESTWDYVIVWGMIVIVLVSLLYAVKWVISPGERDPEHIKYTVINRD